MIIAILSHDMKKSMEDPRTNNIIQHSYHMSTLCIIYSLQSRLDTDHQPNIYKDRYSVLGTLLSFFVLTQYKVFLSLYHLSLSYNSNQIRDQRKQILVLDNHCVEISMVLYQLRKAILLLNKEDQHSYEKLRSIYSSSIEILSNKYIQLQLFCRRQGMYIEYLRLSTRDQFNSVVRKCIKIFLDKD